MDSDPKELINYIYIYLSYEQCNILLIQMEEFGERDLAKSEMYDFVHKPYPKISNSPVL